MKQYKLIKWYPSLPKSWKENLILDELDGVKDNKGNYYFKPVDTKFSTKYLTLEELQKSTEFWEQVVDNNPNNLQVGKTYRIIYKHCKSTPITVKITRITKDGFPWSDDIRGIVTDSYEILEEVVEKDYEILSFCDENNLNFVHNVHEKSSVQALINVGFEIYSVKRLSDGEVFTIGDKINGTISEDEDTRFGPGYVKIISFYEIDNKIGFTMTTGNCTPRYDRLSSIQHYKEPLFTTKDGIDIFEGDKFWMFTSPFNDKDKINIYSQIANGYYLDTKKFTFSTKEAAEEYILMNKPCLSINDIHKSLVYSIELEKLKKIVKSKL